MTTTRLLTLFLALALLALVLLALSAPTARASGPGILRVTVNGATSDLTCGTSWGNPCGLDYALSTVAGSGTELWVAAGTYTPTIGVTRTATFQLRPGVALYGGFAMTETLRTQRNFTANVTILSGDIGTPGDSSDNTYHVVTGSGVTTTAVLDGFTVTRGRANDFSTVPNERGAGMYTFNGSPTVANVTFINNDTSGSGGGMFNDGSSPMLTNVTFSDNSATNTGGGMTNNGGGPTLTNVTFSGNWAVSGGGMFDYNSSNPTLTNVTFSGNSAAWYGGGMNNYNNSSPMLSNVTFFSNSVTYLGDRDGGGGAMFNKLNSSPALTNVTFISNSATFYGGAYTFGGGGGMYNLDGSSPTLSNTTFISNTSALSGGGMYNDADSSPTLSNVTFSGNSAIFYGGGMYNGWSSPTLTDVIFSGNSSTKRGGGGIYNVWSSPTLTNTTFISNTAVGGGGMLNDNSSPMLTNATFSGNSATYSGGGIANSSSSPTLTNVTLVSNSATYYGGGMYTNGSSTITPTVRNTILWSNTAVTGSQIYNDTSSPTISDSVVQGGCPDLSSTCTHIITTDPHLGALGNWGGSTQTIPLLRGSSAIDAGNDATCPPTDQRGKPRVGICDIGAFEFQGFTLTKTGGDLQSTLVNTAFASSLQITLTETEGGLPVAGATITFTAPSSGASAAWSGSLVQTATTNSSGLATVSPPTANGIAGSYTVTATTSGATGPVLFALTNLKHDTTTAITPSANPSVWGETITFTAVVSGASPGGSVAFKDGAESLAGCSAVNLNAGSATCTASSLTAGSHNITAVYSGDANNNSSTGALTFIVDKAHTTTVITSSANPVLASHAVTLTVTVSPVAPGSGTPTGTVDLTETSPAIASVRGTPRVLASHTLVDGVATFSLPALTPGAHAFVATYSGDANYDASTSAIYTQNMYSLYIYLPLVQK